MDGATSNVPTLPSDALKKIDRFLEEYYESGKTQKIGAQIASVGLKSSQIRGLENLLASTTRFSEIINYIKNQVGKEKTDGGKWRVVGPVLLNQLNEIEEAARVIADADPHRRLAVKLLLAKGWARQVVAHYLFSDSRHVAGVRA